MRIFLFVDGWIGAQVLRHLNSQNENIIGIAVHPPSARNNFDEIIEYSKLSNNKIHTVGKKPNGKFIDYLIKACPDIILVVSWTYILQENIYKLPSRGCLNFHMSFLPFNRGKKPNVWPIIENTPAGVSIHYIDSGIDSGKILFRKRIDVEIIDTAKTLYQKQLIAFVNLFEESWVKIKNNNIHPIDNTLDEGTFHLDEEFKKLEEIHLDEKYYPLELINQIRGKTFPPHEAAYFIYKGRKVYVRIELFYGDIM
jgi:methionyl-tRNA formyltransferase